MTERPRIKQRVRPALFLLAIAIFIVIASASLAQRSLAQFHTLANSRAQARMGLLKIEQTLSLFKDLESGSRGFALTGQEEYLEPYVTALASLPTAYAKIKTSLQARELTDFSWTELDALINLRLAIAAEVIAERRSRRNQAFDDTPLLDKGRLSMDTIRARFAELYASQSAHIDAMNVDLDSIRRLSQIFNWAASLITITLMLLSTYLLLRERRTRQGLESELREANRTLEERVAERTHELSAAHKRIFEFANEQDRNIETERRRISREVHDQIGPIFTAIKMIFRALPPATLPLEQEQVLLQALDTGVGTTRRISAELRPSLLDDLGLEAALSNFFASLFQSSGVQTSVNLANQKRLNEQQSMSIFRIAQEVSTNVVRHAAARHFSIQGNCTDSIYQITMMDDGKGMDNASNRPGALGLINIRERAELLGGTMQIDSKLGSGTCFTLSLPLDMVQKKE